MPEQFDAGKSNSTFGRTGEIKVPDNLVAKTNINLTMFLGRLGWRGLLIPVKKSLFFGHVKNVKK